MTTIKIELCEACQNNPWTLTEETDWSDDKGLYPPYHLCAKCHQHLIMRSLRPREWYNLAVLYGPYRYLLSSDFYDDDGTATQPEEPFSISQEDYAPQLQDIANDLPRLIEYCTLKWYLDGSLNKVLLQYSKKELLTACQQKYDSSKIWDIRVTLIEIAGSVLGKTAAPWIRELWSKDENLGSTLSQASIKSLPLQEAFDLITTYLKTVPSKVLPRTAFACLNLCQSPIVLTWMEQNVCEYSDGWARLAASSNPTWEHMHQWISKGRPLSLIALEAMANCAPPYDNVPYLSRLEPKIQEAPSYRIIEKVLLDYEKLDNVPRVNNAVSFIRLAANDIFIGKKFENSKTFLGKLLNVFK